MPGTMRWFTLLGIVILPPMLLSGCNKPTPIKELATQAAKYKGKEVRIQGRVVSNVSLQPVMQGSAYFVSDGTGQLAVVTQQGAPATNSEVAVRGELKDVPARALPVVGMFKLAPVMIEEKERTVTETK